MKNKNIFNKIIGFIIIILLCTFLGLLSYFQNRPLIDINEDILRVYYLNVGQADCTLVVNHGKTMLIDGANEADTSLIIKYLKKLGISKLDYVIATHPDMDHIAGLDKIILAFDAGCIYMPITDKSNKEMNELYNAIENKTVINPTASDYFYLGNSKCTILNSGDTSEVSENNSSIVLQLDYGETNCLFMGDAEKEVEEKVTWNDIDVLKVSHHGSSDATSQTFLETVKPEYSIISVGANNSHNHPSSETLERLSNINSTVYRTDVDGTIILISDGTSYYFDFDTTTILDGNK
jgi:competence protein ComEC